MVVKTAEEAFDKISDSDDVADWKRVFREEDSDGSKSSTAFSAGPSVIKNPSGQWAL
jgi:hypothetical protein